MSDPWNRHMTPGERALEAAMSAVSEEAYFAGWMQGCERDIWRLLQEGGAWGFTTAERLAPLLETVRYLAEVTDRWIVWDGEDQEAIPLDVWRSRYEGDTP